MSIIDSSSNFTPIKYEEPRAYILSMNVLSVIGTCINVSTFLAILFVSPASMKRYKMHLLWYQFGSILHECILHAILPEVFFPPVAVKVSGCLWAFSLKYLFLLGAFSTVHVVIASLQCLLYRHRQFLPVDHWFRFRKRTWLCLAIVNYLYPTVSIFVCIEFTDFTRVSEDTIRVNELLQKYPEFGFIREEPQVWLAALTPLRPPYINLTGMQGVCIIIVTLAIEALGLAFFCFGHAFHLLDGHVATTMSERTRRMQRRLLSALMLQIFVPFLTIAGPWVYYVYLIASGTIVPFELNNVAFLIDGCHSTMSSISIWLFTAPYRKFLIKTMRRSCGLALKPARIGSISHSHGNKNS